MAAAIAIFIGATVIAWHQPPRPVPAHRASLPWSFLHPIETNAHRRLLAVHDELYDVQFLRDGLRGWAVGENGRILSTADGGGTWQVQPSPSANSLHFAVFHPEGMLGWVGTRDAPVLSTDDGGKNWRPSTASWNDAVRQAGPTAAGVQTIAALLKMPPGPAALPSPRSAADTQDSTAREDSAGDGAATVAPSPESVQFVDNARGWGISPTGTVITSFNSGATWTTKSGRYHGLHAIHFAPDKLRGWAVGAGGMIIATTDGGESWRPQTGTSNPDLFSLWVAPDGSRAWAVGRAGTVLASHDRGRSWTPRYHEQSDPFETFTAVTFDDTAVRGWVGGAKGSIVATTDGGNTWRKQSTGLQYTIVSLRFSPDGLAGTATDAEGNSAVTSDGGIRWMPADDKPRIPLRSVWLSPGTLTGWGIDLSPRLGDFAPGGPIVRTEDAGKTWKPVAGLPSAHNFVSIEFDKDGRQGWALTSFGPSRQAWGEVMRTDDGGATWYYLNAPLARGLRSVKFASDGLHGWAVEHRGNILATADGGQHWTNAEAYRRAPAPWYWLAVALCAALVWMSWRLRPRDQPHESVAGLAASDVEVRHPDDDRLNYGGLARGISRFLRNDETQPPLTLAITGDWGSGKSSLMKLVCADLERFGHRPIWFNAWHHQKEEHLFAALLGAIHAQAAPPLCSFSGLAFRFRLLWLRSRHHFGIVMLVVAVFSALTLYSWKAWRGGGVDDVTSWLTGLRGLAAPPTEALTSLAAAVTALLALAKGTRVFGDNPGRLLGQAREHMSLKSAAAQNDFRHQFAREFSEMTEALPYRLVIVIDDLDRCRPAAVIDVMEAVNYLTSAGKCFVIFGMASERVTAALALGFKDIAAELAMPDSAAPGDKTTEATRERTKRHAYAADYLQKLVNIEIKVPSANDVQHHRLLLSREPPYRRRATVFLRAAGRLWPLAALAGAIAAGAWLAMAFPQAHRPPEAAPAKTAQAAVPAPAAAAGSPGQQALPALPETRKSAPLAVQPGDTTSGGTIVGWVAVALLPILASMAVVLALHLRRSLMQTRDSVDFQQALAIWTPVIFSKRGTPRAIKRFGNRLRYLAMLQQGEDEDRTVFDLLLEKLQRWRDGRPEADDTPPLEPGALREYQLIALGALYEVLGSDWKTSLSKFNAPYWREFRQSEGDILSEVVEAAKAHEERFHTRWPPSEKEIAVFERLIAGVRLAGDPRAIDPLPPYGSVSKEGSQVA